MNKHNYVQENLRVRQEMETNRLLNAINFAAIKHKNQRRKNQEKSPYINHPIEVLTLLSNANIADTNTLMAAVLHDTVEDTATKHDELVYHFGEEVAKIVMECTDDKSLDKVQRKKLQIEHAKEISTAAKLVKLSDKLSNMKDLMFNPPTHWTEQEIVGYVVWSYFVVNNLKGQASLNCQLETQLDEIFDHYGVRKMDDAERNQILNNYYLAIDNSE